MARVKKNTTRQLFEEGGGYGGYEIPTLNRWEERKSPGEEVIRGGVSRGLRGLLGVVPVGGGGSSMNNGSSGYAESVFDRVTDRYRPGGKAQILPRDEVESLIPKGEEDESAQIQSGVRSGLVGASAIDPADRPPVTDDTDRILAQLIGGPDPYGAKQVIGNSGKNGYAESVFDRVTDRYRPGGKAQILPRDEVESLIPKGEEAEPTQIQSGVRPGLVGASAIDPADRPPVTDDTDRILAQLIGGPDPYGAKPSIGVVSPGGTAQNGGSSLNSGNSGGGSFENDTDASGEDEDPELQRVYEDVMGVYAAMTGGRPSTAAISAATAAAADAKTALLRELLSGGDTQSGESGRLLSGLLGENAMTGEMDVPEEYAAYADLPSYDTIVPMLESFESEEDMGDYLADMVNKGLISEAVATEYLKRFDDPYEEYDANGRIDYASMVRNPGGWTLINDGGTNFFGGLNRNMRIKSPNGQEFTVAQLYRLLKKNGMDAKEAETHLVKLQNYLKSKE